MIFSVPVGSVLGFAADATTVTVILLAPMAIGFVAVVMR